MFDGNTAETEVLDFLYTLVRLVKPEHAVETGTWLGRSAVAIASALRDNGFGHLISLEADPEVVRYAMAEIVAAGLEDWVEIVTDQSLKFQPQNELQFALLDSDIKVRADEFRHFYEKLARRSHRGIPRHRRPARRDGGFNQRTDRAMSVGRLFLPNSARHIR